MKNKGFTLIELLAVIVILAIIALITIPIIADSISESRDKSALRATELYVESVDQELAKQNLDGKFALEDGWYKVNDEGNILYSGGEKAVEITAKNKPVNGRILIKNLRVAQVWQLKLGDKVVSSTSEAKADTYVVVGKDALKDYDDFEGELVGKPEEEEQEASDEQSDPVEP